MAETETLARARTAINENANLAAQEKELAQLQLNALACSAVKCANGVPQDDPLYNQLLALQTAGEALNQQGTSLDSILGEEAGGQFEHGLKARFDDLLTSQDKNIVRAAGAGQAVAGALGMVGGITMGVASAAGCVPTAGLSCAGVVAGSAITVLSLEQGREGLDRALGTYHHTEGQAVSDSFWSISHQGDHDPSLDLAVDVGIAAAELLAARLGAQYLEKALEGRVASRGNSDQGGNGSGSNGSGVESNDVSNSVIDKPRTGSANKPPDGQHGFNDIVDNYAGDAAKFDIPTKGAGGQVVRTSELRQIEGSNNGVDGVYEWIIDQGNVTHRRFIPGGTVTGLPNQIPNKK